MFIACLFSSVPSPFPVATFGDAPCVPTRSAGVEDVALAHPPERRRPCVPDGLALGTNDVLRETSIRGFSRGHDGEAPDPNVIDANSILPAP